MSAGFKVVLGDLQSMANTFRREAVTYRGLKRKITPPIADGGDPALNDAVHIMLEVIDALHTKMADRIEEHGDKLAYAHDSYQRHDIDLHGAFEDLMPEG